MLCVTSVPGQPNLRVESSATTISLYDERSMESVVDKYIFQWWRDTSVGCSVNHHGNITASGVVTTVVIESLHEDSTYYITVTAINRAGSSLRNITAVTIAAGIENYDENFHNSNCFCVSVPAQLPYVRASTIGVTSITIQWGLLPCIEQNGDITGYKVTSEIRTQTVTGTNIYKVMNLNASVTYRFKVAAMNMVGTGPFRTLTATTLGTVRQ